MKIQLFKNYMCAFVLLTSSYLTAQGYGGITGTNSDTYVVNRDNSNYISTIRLQSQFSAGIMEHNNYNINWRWSQSTDHGNYGVDIMRLTSDGRLGTNISVTGGNAFLGAWPVNETYSCFKDDRVSGNNNYALLQHSTDATYLNAATDKKIHFRNNNTDRMILFADGNLKIGTTSTNDYRLMVNSGDANRHVFRAQANGITKFIIASNGGSAIGAFNTSPPTNGLYVSGKLKIGSNASSPFKLTVDGTIGAKGGIKVVPTGGSFPTSWPDYVFEKDYNLKDLSELEVFIKVNKHLPEVPSAKKVNAEGIELVEMNGILLKKIEELTLHLIAQNKKLQSQEAELQQQKRQLEVLTEMMKEKNQ